MWVHNSVNTDGGKVVVWVNDDIKHIDGMNLDEVDDILQCQSIEISAMKLNI